MAAVLVDELSGNGFFHDLLHLWDTQGWEEADWMECCPRDCDSLTRVFAGCLGCLGNPSSFHRPTSTHCPFPLVCMEVCHLFQKSHKMP